LNAPTRVVVDNSAGPSQHSIYVVDEPNFRVQKLTPAGEFVWMIGKGVDKTDSGDLCTKAEAHTCGAGVESPVEGGFAFSIFVGVGLGGIVHVLDNIEIASLKFKHRLQRFNPDGTLIPPQCILQKGLGGRERLPSTRAAIPGWPTN
jgi:hypothetical protein